MLARSRGVPMVVGLGAPPKIVAGLALLDAEHGGIVLAPTAGDIGALPRIVEPPLANAAERRRSRRAEAGRD